MRIYTCIHVLKDDLVSMSQQSISNSAPSVGIKTPDKARAPRGTANQPDSTNLKNFFQNLLNKNAPAPANSSSSSNETSQRIPTSEQTGRNMFFF